MRASLILVVALGCSREPSHDVERDVAAKIAARAREWCTRIVMPLAAPYTPGYELTVGAPAVPGQVTCELLPAGEQVDGALLRGKPLLMVDVTCSIGIADTLRAALDEGSAQRLPAPGKLALNRGPNQIRFWASRVDCMVDIVWQLRGAGLEPFAAALEQALTPATATPRL